MKKIMIMFAILLLTVSFATAATLTPVSTKAANGAVVDATGAASINNFMKFSKGVYAGAEFGSTGYCLTTAHTSGTKFYGTGYDATAIFVYDNGDVVGTSLTAPSDSAASVAFEGVTGWSKL